MREHTQVNYHVTKLHTVTCCSTACLRYCVSLTTYKPPASFHISMICVSREQARLRRYSDESAERLEQKELLVECVHKFLPEKHTQKNTL
jgi:hypothetical protein